MELQFKKVSIPALDTPVLEEKHMELTQEVRLSDSMPDIGRVLTAWAQPILRSKEWAGDELRVSGGLSVSCAYAPEDGSEIRTVQDWLPFQMKWDLDPKTPEGRMLVLTLLRFAEGRSISSRKMMLRCGISCLMKAVSPGSGELYAPEIIPENVQLLKRTYPLRIPAEAGEKSFQIDEELDLPASVPQGGKLLSSTMTPQITENRVVGDKVVFKGRGNLHCVYRCPEGKIHSMDFELPFSQFSQLDRAYGPDSGAQVFPAVTDLETEILENGKLRIKSGLVGQHMVDEKHFLEVTEDAYSPFRDVEAKREMLMLPTVLLDKKESLQPSARVPGLSGSAQDARFLPDFPRQRRLDGKIQLTVPGNFQLLQENGEGMLQGSAAKWEGMLDVPGAENVVLEAIPSFSGSASALTSAEGTEMTAMLELDTRAAARTEIPMVTGLTLGEAREPDPGRPSLILTRAGEGDLWKIARECGSTVEAIRDANGLAGDPEPDRMLLVPVL